MDVRPIRNICRLAVGDSPRFFSSKRCRSIEYLLVTACKVCSDAELVEVMPVVTGPWIWHNKPHIYVWLILRLRSSVHFAFTLRGLELLALPHYYLHTKIYTLYRNQRVNAHRPVCMSLLARAPALRKPRRACINVHVRRARCPPFTASAYAWRSPNNQ